MSLAELQHIYDLVWPYVFYFVGIPVALIASGHALLYKREVRATLGWVGIILLVPLVGALLYFFFGINRIHRKANRLLGNRQRMLAISKVEPVSEQELLDSLPPERVYMAELNTLVARVVGRHLLPGNRITPLLNGEAAYPSMLSAIENAEHSVSLETYIFDVDEAGIAFCDALAAAKERGVEVRVLIDAVGARYSWPTMDSRLRSKGVNAVRFLPTLLPWRAPYMNLRNHRKILVVDGKTGFTGGMNIRVGHDLSRKPSHPVQDLHFRIEGPVVAHLQETFAEDWVFSTGEILEDERWFPPLDPQGDSFVRGIKDGPDEDFENLRWALLGAIAIAKERICVSTPYFLPDATLITALSLAAMRGVQVDVLLPEKNNLVLVQWATQAHLWHVLTGGSRIYLSPPPFDHTKLVIVDRSWVLLGSTNWDPRSFRLNFEFNLESYDSVLAEALDDFLNKKIQKSRELSLEEIQSLPLPHRLRNGVARLFTPYL